MGIAKGTGALEEMMVTRKQREEREIAAREYWLKIPIEMRYLAVPELPSKEYVSKVTKEVHSMGVGELIRRRKEKFPHLFWRKGTVPIKAEDEGREGS